MKIFQQLPTKMEENFEYADNAHADAQIENSSETG